MGTDFNTGVQRPVIRQGDAAPSGGGQLPDQTGQAGKVLTTDGNSLSWLATGGTGTVTSVDASVPSGFTVSGVPITGAGTIAITADSQLAAKFYGSPTSATGVPTFRALVENDIPSLGASKITSGTLATARLGSGTADSTTFLRGDSTWQTITTGGSVASVGLTMPSIFAVTGSPVTTTGVLDASFNSQAQNLVFASPYSGGSGTPTFRSLDPTDIPNLAFSKITTGTVPLTQGGTGQTTANASLNALLPTQTTHSGKYLTTNGTDSSWATVSGGTGTVTQVDVSVPSELSISGNPVTTSGTLAFGKTTQTANTVWAGPATGIPATSGFRALVVADIPALDTAKITSGTFGTAFLGSGTADSTKFLRGDGSWQLNPLGTVTSIDASVPSDFAVSGVPISSSGTIAITTNTQTANTVWSGPTSGGAANPAFRALVANDIPSLDAGKITTGAFTTSQIPSLDVSKITTGVFGTAFIPTIPLTLGGTGQTTANASLNALLPSQTTHSGKILSTNGTDTSWIASGGAGTVTDVSVTTANGVSGSVATSTTTPAITLTLGAITPTTVNGLTVSSATSSTLTIANGGSLITSGAYSTTLTSSAATNVTLPTTGTLATLDGTETFTNKTLTNPIMTTPTLGVASGTTYNKVTITAPATSATLTLAQGSTLATSGANSITLTSTGATNVTLPTTGTLATLVGTETLQNKTFASGSGTSIDASLVNGGTLGITVGIGQGGTGQTTANAATNALLPSQTTHSGKYLTTNGTDTSWGTVAATPGGSTTQLQYNNAGAFGGISGVTTDGTKLTSLTAAGTLLLNTTGSGATYIGTGSNTGAITMGHSSNTAAFEFINQGGFYKTFYTATINNFSYTSRNYIKKTGGTITAGFGMVELYLADTDGGVDKALAGWQYSWTDATDATYSSEAKLYLSKNAVPKPMFGFTEDAQFKLYGTTSGSLSIAADANTSTHTLNFPANQGSASTFLKNDGTGNLTWDTPAGSGGTVTDVTVATANGVSGSVATSTTTPDITITLGAITPTSVNGATITSTTGTLTLANSSTLATSGANSITLTSTGATNVTLPTTGTLTTNPMTTGGDVIYGGASGVPTRLANGSSGQVLTSAGGTSAPTWTTPAGLTGFTATLETASPNNTVNASYLLASGGSTNQDAVISPKGSGAFQLALADDSYTYGNKRGQNAVDLQITRAGATKVASGDYSFVVGYNNVATQFADIAIGSGNSVSGGGSCGIGIGSGNTITVGNGYAFGYGNTLAAYSSAAVGNSNTVNASALALGDHNTLDANYSVAIGYNNSDTASNTGYIIGESGKSRNVNQFVFATGSISAAGDAQMSNYVCRGTTTNATPKVISPNGGTSCIPIPSGRVYGFNVRVVGKRTDTGTDVFHNTIEGTIANNAGTTAIQGTNVTTAITNSAGTWAATVTANDTSDAMEINVTGEAGATIRWVASVELVEVAS